MSRLAASVSDALSTLALLILAVVVIGFTGFVLADSPSPSPRSEQSSAEDLSSGQDAADRSSKVSLSEARAVLASPDPVVVLVAGDSTGDAFDEWVAEWARSYRGERTVTQRQWSDKREEFTQSSARLGGDGPGLSVWNLSQPGASADYPAREKRLEGVSETPDLVIYSYGHNNTPTSIGADLRATRNAVAEEWGDLPEVVILQNPSNGALARRQQATVDFLRSDFAPDQGLPTIDVYRAFIADDRRLKALLRDESEPNEQGTRLWLDTVLRALV